MKRAKDMAGNIAKSDYQRLLQKEVKDIGNYFLARTDFFPQIGLYGGESGTVLLLAQFYLKTREDKYLGKLKEYLDKMIDLCNECPDHSIFPYFSNGLAGFGWLLCYLKDNQIVDFAEDYLTDIDEILRDKLKNDTDLNRDQLHGRLGIARYFFKRNDVDVIGNEVEILNQTAIKENGEYKWISNKPDIPPLYDTGMAHGMAGILYFLGKSYEMGIKKELCVELGDGILNLCCEQDKIAYDNDTVKIYGSYRPGYYSYIGGNFYF